ncbi:MAG: malonic semialdehyde reductase [Gammaproteobacteria bacterium]|nr:malonic semialdehyde reductase [Gammaproteobacteria bacterium]
MSHKPLSDDALDTLFRSARSHSYWFDKPVGDDLLHKLYDLMKWGPTSGNCTPARLVFVRSQKAKERLKPCLDTGNVNKSMTAPVVAIIGMDMEFYEKLPRLFPHNLEARSWFAGKPEKILETAFRNSSLQGAYFILAARSLGLDCGPMSGFDKQKLDAEFFPDGKTRSNFICAIGYADASRVYPRGPRLDFAEACRVE